MTEDQKKYIAAMKKASTKKPMKALPRPYWRPQAIIFGVITNKKFDMIIMAFIGVNMVSEIHKYSKFNIYLVLAYLTGTPLVRNSTNARFGKNPKILFT